MTERKYFTVPSTGQRLRCRPISAKILRDLDAERADFPKRPTYTITYPGGETEQAEHDETTLETEEDRIAWTEYVECYKEISGRWQERWMRTLIILGIDQEPDDGWEEDFAYLGIEVPTEPHERKVWWANNVILPTDDDKEAFAQTVTLVSTIRREDLERIEASFPGLLRWYSSQASDAERVGLADRDALPGGEGDG